MNFLKRGIELNKLAKAFSAAFIFANQIEEKIDNCLDSNYTDFEQELLVLSYLCRIGIQDRMEKNSYSLSFNILVPSISKHFITISFAYQKTIFRLYSFAEKLDVKEIVMDILEKKDAFYEVERTIPQQFKNKLV